MNQKGQTSIEYILMIVIVVTIATSAFKLIGARITGDQGFIGQYIASFNKGFTSNYKVFTLRR
ncbi:MAG: class III signal peptide-containing protein [Bacteriovoracaceae bacterium]|jgi:uncharacterized protein (UPF0333 family)|nr:class III signal peptide-containing protein [Bacteriovoracaceae bacterium]